MDAEQRLFVDTNILINALVPGMPRHRETLSLLARIEESETEVWISRQIIREFMSALSRPQAFSNPLTAEQIVPAAEELESQFLVAEDNRSVTTQLFVLLDAVPCGGKQLHDANIVATMLTYDIPRLLTYNIEDFRRFEPFITVSSAF